MRRLLAGFVLAFLAVLSFAVMAGAMPMHPSLLQKLRGEGRLEDVVASLRAAREKGVFAPGAAPRRLVTEGSFLDQPSIVILADFSDNLADTLGFPTAHFDSLLFSEAVYLTGSMRDFYLENSYGTVDITGQVTVWVRLPETYAYYTDGQYGFGNYPNNAQRLTEDAVQAADSLVDFSAFDADGDGYVDALFIVHAGPGAEVTGNPWHIWSHAWSTSYPIAVDDVLVHGYSMEPEDGRIGVFCHELGHVFGLPDLYDYGYDSNGLGHWTVMAGGSWGNNGFTPVHFDAWCKSKLGFVTPIEPSADTLNAVEFPLVEYVPVVYKLYMDDQPSHEYFLVENRRNIGFDISLPGPGLCVYHCDDTVSTGNDLQWYPGYTNFGHYLVALEQSDGEWDLEKNYGSDMGDPYPGILMSRTINDTTVPDTKTYSFASTGVCVDSISDPADTMTAMLCSGTPLGVAESRGSLNLRDAVMSAVRAVPDPFRGSVTIEYSLPSQGNVSLTVFDAAGRAVATLVQGYKDKGRHQVDWDAAGKPGGVYFAVLKSAGSRTVARLTLVKN